MRLVSRVENALEENPREMSELAEWGSFYVIVGSAVGAAYLKLPVRN